jgi:hypothetical protein
MSWIVAIWDGLAAKWPSAPSEAVPTRVSLTPSDRKHAPRLYLATAYLQDAVRYTMPGVIFRCNPTDSWTRRASPDTGELLLDPARFIQATIRLRDNTSFPHGPNLATRLTGSRLSSSGHKDRADQPLQSSPGHLQPTIASFRVHMAVEGIVRRRAGMQCDR